jgi:carboxyl-terminal processing protease
MFKRIITILLGAIAGYLMTLGVVQVSQAWGLWPDREASRSGARVREVLLLLNKHYVDEGEVRPEKLAMHAIDSMVGLLDPYSEFLSKDAYGLLEEDVGGEFGGVGVQIEDRDGRLTVVAPIAGTPGERAGILRGDVIVTVDGVSIDGQKLEDAIKRMRGKPGTTVVIGVERGESVATREFTIKREVIKVESVRDAEMIAPGIGYVRVAVFAERTGKEFDEALRGLRETGDLRALVLDLRNNPGGLLVSAVEVVERFFQRGDLVVYTEGRNPAARMELRAESRGAPLNIPIVVLVNGGSASAAEIVAGALRDTNRAVLVGEKTFGKGSVQTVFPLRDGAGLRLTTARYFTPGGAVIHEKGIEPDVIEVLTPEQEKAVFMGRLRADVTDAAEFEARFGVPPSKDTQLEVAVGLLRERLEADK